MGNDYDTGHGLPSEFPSDTSYALMYLTGGLLTVLAIAVIAAAILGYLNGSSNRRRANYDNWPLQLARFIRRSAGDVIRDKDATADAASPVEGIWASLFGGAPAPKERTRRNVRDIDYAKAERVAGHVRSLLGKNLILAKEISGQIKWLSEALEGYKEIKDTAAAGPGAAIAGGTVINIAVHNGAQVAPGEGTPAGPYAPAFAPPAAPSPQVTPPLVIDRDDNIWLAFNKFRDDWNNAEVMAGHLKAAQLSLCARPPEPPRPV